MSNYSPSQRIWRKFKRNKFAVGGLVFIVLMCLISVLGYLIMPDKTPMANDMLLQLSIKKPGRSFTLLNMAKKEEIEQVSFFHKMFFGEPRDTRSIPITEYKFLKDSLRVRE